MRASLAWVSGLLFPPPPERHREEEREREKKGQGRQAEGENRELVFFWKSLVVTAASGELCISCLIRQKQRAQRALHAGHFCERDQSSHEAQRRRKKDGNGGTPIDVFFFFFFQWRTLDDALLDRNRRIVSPSFGGSVLLGGSSVTCACDTHLRDLAVHAS